MRLLASTDYALRLLMRLATEPGRLRTSEELAREIEKRLATIVHRGRQNLPREIDFTTYTLRYNKMAWLHIEGLQLHWVKARVQARVLDGSAMEVQTENVTALTLAMPSGKAVPAPEPSSHGRVVRLDSDRRGHFRVDARVDGRAIDFLVDTGASARCVADAAVAFAWQRKAAA